MKKIETKKMLNLVALCILIIVPFLKIFSMYLEKLGVLNDYDSINPAIVLYISVPFLLFIYIKEILDNNRKLDLYDYIFYILVFSGIISTIFSIDKSISIFGKYYRYEGLLSVLSYYLLFINYKVQGNKKDTENFIKVLVVIGILNSLYALLQIYTDFNFILRYEKDVYMASGLCGNPNFFGSLIVTVLSIVMCRIMINKNITVKEILSLIILFISLINSQSTGPFFTLIIVFIFLILFLCKNRKLIEKNVLIITIVLLGTYIFTYVINKYVYENNRCEMCAQDIKNTIDNGGNGRLKIWENSLEIVKDNFIVGVGFDNFHLAYSNPKNDNAVSFTLTNSEVILNNQTYAIVDNAHNVYLHTLVTTGIVGLIPYLILLLLTFIKGIKSRNYLLLSGFVAYSIQAFANISVVQVAPIYYILIGLILSNNNSKN